MVFYLSKESQKKFLVKFEGREFYMKPDTSVEVNFSKKPLKKSIPLSEVVTSVGISTIIKVDNSNKSTKTDSGGFLVTLVNNEEYYTESLELVQIKK